MAREALDMAAILRGKAADTMLVQCGTAVGMMMTTTTIEAKNF
jgi:hypothetical protein